MKPEDAKKVTGRYRRQLKDSQPKPAAASLLEAFQQVGLPVIYEPKK